MPNITEYGIKTQTSSAIPQTRQPNTQGLNAEVELGNVAKGLGNFASAAFQVQEQSDISDINVALAQAREKLTTDLITQTQDGSLTVDGHKQNTEDTLAGIQAKTDAGTRYLNQQSAALHAETVVGAVRSSAVLAGDKAVANFQLAGQTNANTLRKSPSSYDGVMQGLQGEIQAFVGAGGSAGDAPKLYRQRELGYTEAAARGWIDLDPQGLKKMLADGKFGAHITDDLRHQLDGEADNAITHRRMDEARLEEEKRKALVKKQDATKNEFFTRMLEGNLSFKDIDKSDLEPEDKPRQAALLERSLDKIQTETDARVFNDLFTKIHKGEIVNEGPLVDSTIARKLSIEDLGKLRNELGGRSTEKGKADSDRLTRFLNLAKRTLNPKGQNPMGLPDPVGEQREYSFTNFVFRAIAEGKKAGKTLDQMTDERSADYIGKEIFKYLPKDTNEIMRDTMSVWQRPQEQQPWKFGDPEPSPTPTSSPSASPSTVEKRAAGESIADYRKRTGK